MHPATHQSPARANSAPFASLETIGEGGTVRYELSECDGKRVALLMTLGEGKPRVFRGHGRWMRDDLLGEALRIRVDGEDNAEILIAKSQWRGKVTVDSRYGCDCCITVG